VTVDHLPFAVLSAVDMRNAQIARLDGAAVDSYQGCLVTDDVPEITADVGGNNVELKVGAVGEPRRDGSEHAAHALPSALRWPKSGEEGHGIIRGPEFEPTGRVAVVHRVCCLEIRREDPLEELRSVAHGFALGHVSRIGLLGDLRGSQSKGRSECSTTFAI
jgi:hypothetical protein